jgi:hypothetical protein
MSKKSAIESELNIIIVLNNLNKYSNNVDDTPVIREIEMVEFPIRNGRSSSHNSSSHNSSSHNSSSHSKRHTPEEKSVSRGRGGERLDIKEIESDLKKCEHTILIKNRKRNGVDTFNQILEYMWMTEFCGLPLEYVKKSLFSSDFIIFINNGIDDSIYQPKCIAFIIVLKDSNNHKFLYISMICSDEKWGLCGGFLMNTIKYIATILKCNEIRLDSVDTNNALKFYKNNNFINYEISPVKYNHYYHVIPEDAVFHPAPVIQGHVSITPWYLPLIENQGYGKKNNFTKTKKRKMKKRKMKKRKSRKHIYH